MGYIFRVLFLSDITGLSLGELNHRRSCTSQWTIWRSDIHSYLTSCRKHGIETNQTDNLKDHRSQTPFSLVKTDVLHQNFCFASRISYCTAKISKIALWCENMGYMHSVSANQIADIFTPNDKDKKGSGGCPTSPQSWLLVLEHRFRAIQVDKFDRNVVFRPNYLRKWPRWHPGGFGQKMKRIEKSREGVQLVHKVGY